MVKHDTTESFIRAAKRSAEEDKIEWIENLARIFVGENAPLIEVAKCTAAIDNVRYGMAEHFLKDYQGGIWDYYTTVVEKEEGGDFAAHFVVYDNKEPLNVENDMNMTAYEGLDPVTASAFVWVMTLTYVATVTESDRGYQFAEDLKYFYYDSLPEDEMIKLARLLD